MLKRVTIVALAFVLMAGVGSVFAQPEPPQGPQGMSQRRVLTPEERAKMDAENINLRVEAAAQNLGLSSEQQMKVRALLTKTNEEIRKMIDKLQTTAGEMMKSDNEKIEAMLTPEQKTKLEQLRAAVATGQVVPGAKPPKLEEKKKK